MTSKHECEKRNTVPFAGKFSSAKRPLVKLSPVKVSPTKFVNHLERVADKCHVQISRKINPVWTVERLFGKRHWVSQWVIDLCESDAQFLLHLIDQSPDYVHFICLVRLALLGQSVSEENQLAYAERIRTQSKKKTIQILYPSGSAGILGVLTKLQKTPLPQEGYRQLIRALMDDNMRKCLHHTKHVRKFDIRLLELLENIPKEFQVSGIFNCIEDIDDYKHLLVLIKTAQVLNLEITQQEVNRATREMDKFEQIEKWFKRKFAMLPFPTPPWQGNEWIKPLCSRSEMQAAADKFKNCIMRYVSRVVLGYSYFYVCERTPAVIKVKKTLALGWCVDEIEGARRGQRGQYLIGAKNISRVEEHEIMQVFNDAGFLPVDESEVRNHCDIYE